MKILKVAAFTTGVINIGIVSCLFFFGLIKSNGLIFDCLLLLAFLIGFRLLLKSSMEKLKSLYYAFFSVIFIVFSLQAIFLSQKAYSSMILVPDSFQGNILVVFGVNGEPKIPLETNVRVLYTYGENVIYTSTKKDRFPGKIHILDEVSKREVCFISDSNEEGKQLDNKCSSPEFGTHNSFNYLHLSVINSTLNHEVGDSLLNVFEAKKNGLIKSSIDEVHP